MMVASRTYVKMKFINSILTYRSVVPKPLFGNRPQPNTPTHSNVVMPNSPLVIQPVEFKASREGLPEFLLGPFELM